jgi:hypothetical protein
VTNHDRDASRAKPHRNSNEKWCKRNKDMNKIGNKIGHTESAQQRNFPVSIQKIQNQQD